MFNDETLSEQVTLTELMADREEEKHNAEVSKQFDAFKDSCKPNKGLQLQGRCPLLLNIHNQENNPQINENLGESKQIQLSVEIPQQPLSTLVEEDSNQDETENGPLWSMYFDGSCTKNNAGAGV